MAIDGSGRRGEFRIWNFGLRISCWLKMNVVHNSLKTLGPLQVNIASDGPVAKPEKAKAARFVVNLTAIVLTIN